MYIIIMLQQQFVRIKFVSICVIKVIKNSENNEGNEIIIYK